MLTALNADGFVVYAKDSTTGWCPKCREQLIRKAGTEREWHWAHHKDSTCPWSETHVPNPDTIGYGSYQQWEAGNYLGTGWISPEDAEIWRRKRLITDDEGNQHFNLMVDGLELDLVGPNGGIKLAPGYLMEDTIQKYEDAFPNMSWLIPGKNLRKSMFFTDHMRFDVDTKFTWREGRQDILRCKRPVIIDFDDFWIAIFTIHTRDGSFGTGRWASIAQLYKDLFSTKGEDGKLNEWIALFNPMVSKDKYLLGLCGKAKTLLQLEEDRKNEQCSP